MFGPMLVIGIAFTIRFKKSKDKSQHSLIDILIISATLFIAMVSIWYSAYHDSHRVKHFKRYFGVKVIYQDNRVFVSDSTNYYIGNTSNYLFIYNEKEDKTVVERISDVKSIEFPKRKDRSF
jgi:hypothetical protein